MRACYIKDWKTRRITRGHQRVTILSIVYATYTLTRGAADAELQANLVDRRAGFRRRSAIAICSSVNLLALEFLRAFAATSRGASAPLVFRFSRLTS
jgi:hypothetical protein